jgi:hypothetical protein
VIREATLTTTIVKQSGESQNDNRRTEERFPIEGLVTDTSETSKVTQAVSTKISDALYYGEGKWDKIPYTVEVFSSVTLHCDQSEESLLKAQNIAHQLAFESAQERLKAALMGHVSNMRNNLYRSMFNED